MNQYSGDLRTGTSTELDDLGGTIVEMQREIRRLKAWKEEVSSGNMLRASNIQGTIPAANGGSAVPGNTLGSVDPWNNASGATQVQGTVVTENGNRTFGTTTTVDDLTVIGVLDDASIAVGVDGRIRHNGYQAVVKTQGVVTAGHYLRSSATVGRAEDSGLAGSAASFAIALTASAGGAATVAAYVFPIGMAGALAPIGGSFITVNAEPSLPSERQLSPVSAYTPVGGVGAIDGGANALITLTLKDLVADWIQAAVKDISTAGNLTVLKHLAAGSGSVIDATALLAFLETATTAALGAVSAFSAVSGTVSLTQNAATAIPVLGFNAVASMGGNFTALAGNEIVGAQFTSEIHGGADSPALVGVRLLAKINHAASVATNRYGTYVSEATGPGALTNQYGMYIEALTKGGTLNRALYSAGGASVHVGSIRFGDTTAPSEIVDVLGNVAIKADNLLKLYDSDNSNFIAVRADSARTTDLTYVLPATDPTVGQVLSPSAPSGGVVTLTWVDSDTPAYATVATTDATQTTLATITIPTGTTVLIKAMVAARRTGGSGGTAEDGAGYEIMATAKNVGGTATLIGAVAAVATQEDQAGWDATIDVTAATARVRVTGAVNNNVDWKCSTKTLNVT